MTPTSTNRSVPMTITPEALVQVTRRYFLGKVSPEDLEFIEYTMRLYGALLTDGNSGKG